MMRGIWLCRCWIGLNMHNCRQPRLFGSCQYRPSQWHQARWGAVHCLIICDEAKAESVMEPEHWRAELVVDDMDGRWRMAKGGSLTSPWGRRIAGFRGPLAATWPPRDQAAPSEAATSK